MRPKGSKNKTVKGWKKFASTLPPELLQQFRERAEAKGIKLNELFKIIIERFLGENNEKS